MSGGDQPGDAWYPEETVIAESGEMGEGARPFVLQDDTVGAAFFLDQGGMTDPEWGKRDEVKIIRGPIGSGKTAICCHSAMQEIQAQPKSPIDGKRYTRGLITRTTYSEVKNTTLAVWEEFFPRGKYGVLTGDKPMLLRINQGDIVAEILWMALESEADAHKVRSLALTWAYINEMQYFNYIMLGEIVSRTNRFPPKRHAGMRGFRVFGDMNAPDTDHFTEWTFGPDFGRPGAPDWLPEEERQAYIRQPGWYLYEQPAGLVEIKDPTNPKRIIGYETNPLAENQLHLADDYYTGVIKGKTKSWIDVNVMNRPGSQFAGNAVYPEFDRNDHVAPSPLPAPYEGEPISIGVDPGDVHCAAVFAQEVHGRVFVFRELLMKNTKAGPFGWAIKRMLAKHFPDHFERGAFRIFGDPYGNTAHQAADETAYQVMKNDCGLIVKVPKYANYRRAKKDIDVRKDTVSNLLLKRAPTGGGAAMIIDPECRILIKGFQGGYRWKEPRSQDGTHADFPKVAKTDESHIVESFEYLCVGERLGEHLVGGADRDNFRTHKAPMNRASAGPRRQQARRSMQRINDRRHGR